MTMSFMTSASFDQNPGKAKQAAKDQPVVITDHGKPTHVLVTYEQFEANWKPGSALSALEDRQSKFDDDFDPPRLSWEGRKIEF